MKIINSLSSSFLFLLIITGCNKSQEKQPNIILILADDLGYNDISSYREFNPHYSKTGLPTSKTPHIDLLAEQGMKFTDFYAGASVCSPSRAAILTGRNATRAGIYNFIPPDSPMHLRADEITIAHLLQGTGYQTGHFGKWHLGVWNMDIRLEGHALPNHFGYDHTFYTYNNAVPSHRNPDNFFRNGEPLGLLEGFSCDLVVEEAINWLEKKDNKEPFYINIWFNEPHASGISYSPPYAAPQELIDRHEYNKEHYASVENMDAAVGKLLDYLLEKKLDKNTIVIFSSDNGSQWEYSNDPLRGSKHFNYEGGVRVPFIVRWPGKTPPGLINSYTGSFADFLPTITSITGTKLPEDRIIDGIDISQAFKNLQVQDERNIPIFFFRYYHDPILMLREGDWCLLGYDELIPSDSDMDIRKLAKINPWRFEKNHMDFLTELYPKYFELYNLSDDREQRNDLSAKYPEIVERLKYKMISLKKEMVNEGGNWYEDQIY